jgi:hypothetical protein
MLDSINIQKEIEFEETQRFTTWIVWLAMIGTLLVLVAAIIHQIVTGESIGNHPASNGALIAILLIYYVPAISLMLYARLTVRITNDTIYYGWNIPTKDLNTIKWADVQSSEIITYKYVGHGYRLTKKYGIVYNTKGNKGLLITKKSGEKVLLGSLKIDELDEVNRRISGMQKKL